jgi:hypothetical protein
METYPVAPLDEASREEVGNLVARASTLVEQYQVADHNLAEWLRLEFDLKGLKPALLSASLLNTDRFLSAVRDFIPKKRKLSVAQLSELKREYTATIEPARNMRSEVLASEHRLSDLVNQAYGLTADEVDLMWRTAPPRMPFTPQGFGDPENGIAEETEVSS